MSAWTTGIGLGLEAARMQQQRDQFAQEQAFRQQQAAIDNSQRDRQFQAAQTADTRDFDAMQQWRAFQQQQAAQQFAERKAALDRDLMGQQATAQVFRAISAPDIPAAPGGVGPIQPHPVDTLDDNTLMNAAPQALSAYVSARQNRSAIQQRRQFAEHQVSQARADGSLKLVDPRTAQEWADLGLYSDGTIAPDEMPTPIAKQREAQQDAMAQIIATEQGPDGSMALNQAVYQHYKAVPFEMLKVAYEQKSRRDAAVEVARIRQMTQPAQPVKRDDALLNTLQEKYRALTGKNGSNGPIVAPTAKERELAKATNLDTGWMDFTGPEPEDVDRAQQKVKIWDQMESIINGTAPQQQAPGLLDTADQTTPVQQPDAVDALIDQLLQPQ